MIALSNIKIKNKTKDLNTDLLAIGCYENKHDLQVLFLENNQINLTKNAESCSLALDL